MLTVDISLPEIEELQKLVETGKLRLDDRAGTHVKSLHRAVARATVAQLLSIADDLHAVCLVLFTVCVWSCSLSSDL